MDFRNSIFAVADSPDWNPTASRCYLSRFSNIVEGVFSQNPDTRESSMDIQLDMILNHTNRLVKDIDRKHCTAFSGIIIIRYRGKLNGLILHCGDCLVFKVNIRKRNIVQITRTNMSFIGCSDQISQVEVMDIDENDRLVLCTDGIQALSRNAYFKSLPHILLHSLISCPMHSVPDTLFSYYGNSCDIPDDMSIIVMNPNELMISDCKLLMGGYEFG